MKGRWFNLLSNLSLLLCLASAALWIHSYFATDAINFGQPKLQAYSPDNHLNAHTIRTFRGRIGYCFQDVYLYENLIRDPQGVPYAPDFPGIHSYPGSHIWLDTELIKRMNGWQHAGFEYHSAVFGSSTKEINGLAIIMPLWPIVLLAALLPLIRLRRWLRLRRHSFAGCCTMCGYDLRATPDRCPECGAIPANNEKSPPSTAPPATIL
jgi:hypothetical protein